MGAFRWRDRRRLVALVAAAVAIGLWALRSFYGGEGGADPASPAPPRHPIDVPDSAPNAALARPGDYTLRSGEIIRISADTLPVGRPVALDLVLAEPSRNAEPLSTQVRDTRGRVLDLFATLQGDERTSARLEIEAGWLSPGDYLVEVRTTERSHFSLRRYPLEVR